MVVTCSECGRQVRDEDAVYCAYCANPLKAGAPKKTDFPTAGGVLMILAASTCVLAGMVSLGIFCATYQYMYFVGSRVYYTVRYEDLLAGAVGILAFVYGLAGGILALKRKKLVHCLAGGFITVLEGFVVILAFAQQWPGSWVLGVLFGFPLVILSAAGFLFVSISKGEFK